jgi:hypothetical protein
VTSTTTFSISPDGSCPGASCTATVPGPHTVTGTKNVKTGTASLTVNAGAASRLAITAVNGGVNPSVGSAFPIVVQSQDASGNAANVTSNTAFSLARATGTGTLGGTATGIIANGTNSITVSGLTYNKAESGVSIIATRTSGMTLSGGTSAAFIVDKGNQTITFNALGAKTYGDADFSVSATASSALTVSFTSQTLGVCTVSGTTVHLVAQGTCTIRASQAGDSNYNAAPNVDQSFTVNKKAATITANDNSKTYGTVADPALSVTSGGFVAADLGAGKITFSAARVAGESATTYVITPAASDNGSGLLGNYTVTPTNGTFTINQKAASVTPAVAGKTYGSADPALTGTLTGFLAADGVTANYSRTAGETVGAYVISATLAPAGVLGNYDITSTTAAFDIAKKTASVTPAAAGKTYGSADPALSGTLTGFQAGDGVTASYARTAGETVGSYTISAPLAPAGVLGNYDITSNTAAFDIGKKTASVTPAVAGKTYGSADPALSGTLTGFLAADGVTASYSRTAGETVGAYVISATLAPANVLSNYDVTSNTATFNITKKSATIKAEDNGKSYGTAADPTLSVTPSGFLATDLGTGKIIFTTTRGAGESAGAYTITPAASDNGSGLLANYTVTPTSGTFTIDRKALTITVDGVPGTPANDAFSKTYGAANPSFSVRYDGFVNGDTPATLGGTLTYTTAATASSQVGNCSVTSGGLTSTNYTITYTAGTLKIVYGWNGFLQPINDTAHQTSLTQSKFKLGQTIPAKFVITNAAGSVVQQTSNPNFARSENLGVCDANATPDNVPTVDPEVIPQFVWDGSQYHYNWSTKGLTTGRYRIFANLADGNSPWVDICLTK